MYKDTTADLTFQDGETEKTITIPTIDFTEQADSIFDFKVKMTSVSDNALLGFASEATIQVMKAELLQKDQTSYDDQATQLDYSPVGTMKPIHQVNTKTLSLGRHLVV